MHLALSLLNASAGRSSPMARDRVVLEAAARAPARGLGLRSSAGAGFVTRRAEANAALVRAVAAKLVSRGHRQVGQEAFFHLMKQSRQKLCWQGACGLRGGERRRKRGQGKEGREQREKELREERKREERKREEVEREGRGRNKTRGRG